MIRTLLSALALSVALTSLAAAHDPYRVIGKITKQTERSFDMVNQYGTEIYVTFDQNTAITRDDQPVPATELKVGQQIILNAEGDSQTELEAREIQLVPSP